MKKILLVFAFVFGLSATASAGLLVEPKLGYFTGDFNSTTDNSTNGLLFGVKLGYSFLGGYAALEFETGDLGGDLSDTTATNYGLTLGYNFPILINAWFTFVFDPTVTQSQDFSGGSGIKIGGAYKFLPLFSAYLEYVDLSYTKLNGVSLASDAKLSGFQFGAMATF
ncbi:MAG: hypothetical protein AB8E15_12920 [Bdellovibrionales bacterium]